MFELLETPDSCLQLTKHGGGVSASLNYAVLRSHPQNCVRRTAQNCAELRRRNGHLCDAPCSFCSPWTLVKTMFEHSSSVHSLRILVGLDPWPCGCARPNKLNQSLTLAYGLPASYMMLVVRCQGVGAECSVLRLKLDLCPLFTATTLSVHRTARRSLARYVTSPYAV